MTDPMLWTVAGGAWLILFAGFVGLWLRFARLRSEADALYATGALDADQATVLRGDVARRRAVTQSLRVEADVLRATLVLALDELAASQLEVERLGEAVDDALAAADASELAAFRAVRRQSIWGAAVLPVDGFRYIPFMGTVG